ncbi:NAD(P)-binding domain-containing protein [Nocardia sp. CWNU-33]|uniref:NAD(P)-binding domain-containing protein n=1 Tax=Nocardia sp. CWNU-33 TaxID=3392117 RepID=UPI00398E995B
MTAGERTPVIVIGLGSMGSALAEAFVRAGHPTTVWNRSPEKAASLVARGATSGASAPCGGVVERVDETAE